MGLSLIMIASPRELVGRDVRERGAEPHHDSLPRGAHGLELRVRGAEPHHG
jgi:hypothetical protein